jgi:hypothetical protein
MWTVLFTSAEEHRERVPMIVQEERVVAEG